MLRNKLQELIQKRLTKAWHDGNLDHAAVANDIINHAVSPLLDEEGVILLTDDPGAETNGCIRTNEDMSAIKLGDNQWALFYQGETSFVNNDYVVGWLNSGVVPNTAREVEPVYIPPEPQAWQLHEPETPYPLYEQAVHEVGGDPLSNTPYADTDFIELDTVWPEEYPRHFRHIYTNVRWRLVNGRIESFSRGKWEQSAWDDIEAFLADNNIEEITENGSV